MANAVLDFNLGAYIQIAYTKGIRNQISEDFRDWEYVKRQKAMNPDGRELKFMFKNGYGPAAIQYSRVTDFGFAKGQQISVSEYTAEYQDMDCTVEFDFKLWDRARKNPNTYGDFLAEELSSKILSQKRQLAKDLYGDGTGVVGEVASIDETNIAAGNIEITLDTTDTANGHLGLFEFDDLLIAAENTGALRSPTVTTNFYAYRVLSKDRKNSKVVLELVDSDYALDLDAAASGLVAGDVFYRVGLDATAARVNRTTIADYGKELVIPGLASLAAADGRIVHGITMSGRTGATEESVGGVIANDSIENVMNDMKIRVGEGSYAWKMICAAPEAHSKFILAREDARRFQTVDTVQGGKKFVYMHRDDALEIYATEFVPKTKMYILPEAKNGNKVIEYNATDYETVKVNDTSAFHLAVENGGFTKKIQTFMTAKGTLICKHPAAIGVIRNFTL